MPAPLTEDQIWDRVEKTETCWTWRGHIDVRGYGRASLRGRKWYAHRLVFSLANGPVPDGLELDHLCRNHSCVNPAHLEAVPHGVNVLRGLAKAAIQARTTHCRRCGGPYDRAQKHTSKKTGREHLSRTCSSCKREKDRVRWRAKKDAKGVRT